MKRITAVVIVAALVFSIGGISYSVLSMNDNADAGGENGSLDDNQFSFESGMENWRKNGTDLDNPPVDWSIERSQELATDGENSLKFYLSNVNDAGKIWIEKAFDADPNSYYRVNVSYDFASAIYGDFNLWRIITGVSPNSPSDAKDLMFQGDAGNGADNNVGFKWLKKSYEFVAKSSQDNELYVYIGVWGTWETDRTYYVDNVEVEFEKLDSSDFVSEEKSKEIAENFVKNSATYEFDGYDLEHKETLYPEIANCPSCYTFVFEFTSSHGGYGDRTGEPVTQVITPHEAHVTLENGEIVNAVLDNKWDMIEQTMIEGALPPSQ